MITVGDILGLYEDVDNDDFIIIEDGKEIFKTDKFGCGEERNSTLKRKLFEPELSKKRVISFHVYGDYDLTFVFYVKRGE